MVAAVVVTALCALIAVGGAVLIRARRRGSKTWVVQISTCLLVASGAYLAIGSAWVEFHEGRLGMGLGIVTTTALAAISGVIDAFHPPKR